jgi:hypothetical protein
MKYNNFPIITPAAVYHAQKDGYKFVRLSEEQIELAEKAHKELHTLEYETEDKKVVCVGVYVKVSDLIKIAL